MIKPSRAIVVAEARAWCGVPIFHKGRDRAGVDCLGVVLCVGYGCRALVGPIDIPDYGKLPNPKRLVEAMDLGGVALPGGIDDAGDGDIIGISWGVAGQPMHLAIRATYDGRSTIIHADPKSRAVVETGFAGPWLAAAEGCPAWRYPLLDVSHG